MIVFLTGSSGYLGKEILKNFRDKYTFITPDLRKENFENGENADYFINCIGKTPDQGNFSYQEYYDANYKSVEKLFNLFLKSNAEKFIHFSSISAVEELSFDGLLNEDNECNPISDYGKTKRMAEEFLLSQTLPHNKKIIILRPTRIHGENDKGTILQLYKFVKKIPYPFGSYDNKRSFLALDNLLYFIDKILQSKAIDTGVYNVNDDEPLSTVDIINTIQKVEGRKIMILKIPKILYSTLAKIGDKLHLPFNSSILDKITTSRVVSNQKIKKALSIDKLPLSAIQGIEKTIKSFS